MKGVILTATGEPVATPSPAELAKLFVDTPKVGLNFAKIFDFDSEGEDDSDADEDGYETDTKPPPPSRRQSGSQVQDTEDERTPQPSPAVRPTRLRRPSIRASSQRPMLDAATSSSARSKPSRPPSSSSSTSSCSSSKGLPSAASARSVPDYDLSDEENLPSPFLKKQDREAYARTASAPAPTASLTGTIRNAPRKSGSTLRAMAVVNAANAANTATGRNSTSKAGLKATSTGSLGTTNLRPSIAKAHKAGEEARKALFRP